MKTFDVMPQWLWDVSSAGLPRNYDLEVLRKTFLLNLVMFLGIIFLTLLGTLAFIQSNCLLGAADFLFCSLLIALFIFLRKRRKHLLVSIIAIVMGGVFFFFLIASGGVENTAFVWVFTYPLISLFLLGARWGTVASLLLLCLAIMVFVLGDYVNFFSTYSPNLIMRVIPAYIMIYLFAFVKEKSREIVQNRLEKSNLELENNIEVLEKTNKEKEQLLSDLKTSTQQIKLLQGILPICTNCKKIRDDKGYWQQVEVYIRDHSDAVFSHGLCPECRAKLYPDLYGKKK
jgi:hypothetical protein